ncbi:trimeric intracellular cation channel family protein [Larsenimonas salina]|uniref:trimeric intracellular cation channel family protein n=1 Tax=Larsenimonas salina TaxID=1295565 RepID=UPI0020732CD3|nr:trimeric intracellular cation channel family protein [Larsenimonas salina]
MHHWIYLLDLAGVVVFALSGIALACRVRMDPIGMLVLAAVTGIGGGTLRDLLLGVRPVFWVTDPTYLWVILATVIVSMVGLHFVHHLPKRLLSILDAFGLALFTVLGANKAMMLDYTGIVAVLMGLLTGVAGGACRDVLAGRIPMVLRQEIYATASILGAAAYVALVEVGAFEGLALALGLGVTLMLRLSAIYWHLALPTFVWLPRPEEERYDPERDPLPPGDQRRHKRVQVVASRPRRRQ